MKIALLGATGRTGRIVIEEALRRGHSVRALARDAAKVEAREGLEVVEGQATRDGDVARVVEGCDAVVASLASSNKEAVCSAATNHVIAAAKTGGPDRYLAISGAGVDRAGDAKGTGDKVVGAIMKVVVGGMLRDRQAELAALEASTLRWTLARPPRLVDGDASAYRTSLERPQASSVTRAAVAHFLLDALEKNEFVREAPFVSG